MYLDKSFIGYWKFNKRLDVYPGLFFWLDLFGGGLGGGFLRGGFLEEADLTVRAFTRTRFYCRPSGGEAPLALLVGGRSASGASCGRLSTMTRQGKLSGAGMSPGVGVADLNKSLVLQRFGN